MLLVGGCVVAIIAFLGWPGEREPEHNGTRLSAWLTTVPPQTILPEYVNVRAFQNFGSNGVPFLVKWIDYDPPKWRGSLDRVIEKLPLGMSSSPVIDRLSTRRRAALANNAMVCLMALDQEMINDEMPKLTSLAMDLKRPNTAKRATTILLYPSSKSGELAPLTLPSP
jgi:hypothetical protein